MTEIIQIIERVGFPVAIMVGRDGGKLSAFADIELRVDSTDMQVLENVQHQNYCIMHLNIN